MNANVKTWRLVFGIFSKTNFVNSICGRGVQSISIKPLYVWFQEMDRRIFLNWLNYLCRMWSKKLALLPAFP